MEAPRDELQVIGAVCLFVASKLRENDPIPVDSLIESGRFSYTTRQIRVSYSGGRWSVDGVVPLCPNDGCEWWLRASLYWRTLLGSVGRECLRVRDTVCASVCSSTSSLTLPFTLSASLQSRHAGSWRGRPLSVVGGADKVRKRECAQETHEE